LFLNNRFCFPTIIRTNLKLGGLHESSPQPKNAYNCFFLQDGVVIVDSPGIGDSEHVSNIVLEYMSQACAFVYVINSPLMQEDYRRTE